MTSCPFYAIIRYNEDKEKTMNRKTKEQIEQMTAEELHVEMEMIYESKQHWKKLGDSGDFGRALQDAGYYELRDQLEKLTEAS